VGIARPVNVPGLPGAGRLKVRFLPGWLGWMPFAWGEYWILKLDRDYQVALVGSPDRHYLWVLSRVPDLDEASLQAELDYARTLGFEVDQVVRNAHCAGLRAGLRAQSRPHCNTRSFAARAGRLAPASAVKVAGLARIRLTRPTDTCR